MPPAMDAAAELPLIDLDFSLKQKIRFSYSRPEDPVLKKAVICGIEKLSGQGFFKRHYLDWSNRDHTSENIFAAGIRLLGITLAHDAEALAAVPTRGPLLVVANHPYGVADGLGLGDLVTRVRPDTKIMTHSLLCQPPEAQRFMLPVDFGNTAAARQRSARTRREAVQWLKDGHCVALFPAGGVATRQKPTKGPALDLPWHPFVSKLAAVAGVQVLPLFFHGQNSTLFHLASHTSYPLRIALLFRETLRQLGSTINVDVGAPVPGESLPHGEGKEAVAAALRAITFGLDKTGASSVQPFDWPKHVAT
jgi:putative hemolysin